MLFHFRSFSLPPRVAGDICPFGYPFNILNSRWITDIYPGFIAQSFDWQSHVVKIMFSLSLWLSPIHKHNCTKSVEFALMINCCYFWFNLTLFSSSFICRGLFVFLGFLLLPFILFFPFQHWNYEKKTNLARKSRGLCLFISRILSQNISTHATTLKNMH